MTHDSAYWSDLDALVATSRIVVDRPKGSAHPRYPSLVYPVDYGYLEGTAAPDGHEIDVWVGSLGERQLLGVVCTTDKVKKDAEVKLLLGCTPEEVQRVLATCNTGPMSAMLVLRR